MQSNKNTWITLLTLLLVFLQPAVSFGNISTFTAEVLNTQEEIALFKTKSTKALVYEEISITSVELVVSSASGSNGIYFDSTHLFQIQDSSQESNYLIDIRGVLTTQIFPFHFFL